MTLCGAMGAVARLLQVDFFGSANMYVVALRHPL